MNANVRNEEVTALGDFVLTSYIRDFEVIKGKFTKMDEAFRDGFIAKLNFVKRLESKVVLNESRKGITESLYAEAARLNTDLNFVSVYFTEAGLNAHLITSLKHLISVNNIEGVVLELEGLLQFINVHHNELTAQGMDAHFEVTLNNYKDGLMNKNKQQDLLINQRKQLVEANLAHYTELLGMIRKIARNGKLVFKGMVKEDEYTTLKVIKRMRAAPKKDVPVKE